MQSVKKPLISPYRAAESGTSAKRNQADRRLVENENQRETSWVRDTALTVIWYMLLLEWLSPLALGAAEFQPFGITPYAVMFGYFLLISAGVRSFALLWTLKLAGIAAVSGYQFQKELFPFGPWPVRLWETFLTDLDHVASGQLGALSGLTESLLFLFGAAAFISASHQLLLHRQNGAWFAAATGGYLMLLQVGLGIDTTPGLIRTGALGLLLLAGLTVPRLRRQFGVSATGRGGSLPWMGLSVLAAAIFYAAGTWAAGEAGSAAKMKPLSLSAAADKWAALTRGHKGSGAGQANGSSLRISGYGADDSVLGGALISDSRVVFTARMPVLAYWRGEAKSVYDGRGWSQPSGTLRPAFPALSGQAESAEFSTGVATSTEAKTGSSAGNGHSAEGSATASVVRKAPDAAAVKGPYTQEVTGISGQLGMQLFAGGEVLKLEEATNTSGQSVKPETFWLNNESGKVALPVTDDPLQSYRVTVKPFAFGSGWSMPEPGPQASAFTPVSDAEIRSGLRSSANGTGSGGERFGTADSSDVNAAADSHTSTAGGSGSRGETAVGAEAGNPERNTQAPAALAEPEPAELAAYLQLPEGLPQRVRDLAERVTAGRGQDRLAAALALERYLRTEYRYSMDKPTLPAAGEDFVDHFLFVDKLGYCDHFSSAMVVMLRAAGIPARWVKGFAPGEAGERGPDGSLAVTVRSRDAHSWAEAYIPGAGWLAFEPTPGFAAPSGVGAAAVPAAVSSPEEETAAADTAGPWAAQLLPALAQAADSPAAWGSAALLALLGAAWLLRRFRPRRASQAPLRRSAALRRGTGSTALMERLWLKVFRSHGRLAPQQTLREYVAGLVGLDPGRRRALEEFAALYEEVRYDRSGAGIIGKGRILELWKRIEG
ncbi:transglutaminase family protein [Paenibacillus sp. GbtcB18]|uniref:transglutaminase-like domain-containing protein n=1 Tax=Paenibacillus sp. GbtcB18 TaxID=2824763 RepID=UPI001C2F1528|nr:transglutaminase-like domain-containing protein [Paenibacillus sp. GbtcB18]